MDFDASLEKFVLKLHEIGGLKFGDFKMKVGINSPVYVDLRVLVSHPTLMDLLADMMGELIRKTDVGDYKHICGVPYTALPIASLVSVKSKTPMLVRRKEAKSYGTRKMVEGQFAKGDSCLIIEDVVTSGSSILETVEDLKREGLSVSSVVVVLDREQGGVANLAERGINMHVLARLSGVLDILHRHGRLTDQVVASVHDYIGKTQIRANGTNKQDGDSVAPQRRLTMTFAARAKTAKNPLAARLLRLMEEKQTTLCVAADVATCEELLKVAADVGPHVCVLKTHADTLPGFDEGVRKQLARLAAEHNFLILEDRKLSDIGHTVSMQYGLIHPWADLVTAHSLSGGGVVQGMLASLGAAGAAGDRPPRGAFLVAQLSCEGHLMDSTYIQRTVAMAEQHADFVVGVVCQSGDALGAPHLLQLTPGVSLEAAADGLGQRYSHPRAVVLERGADVAVVGRGVVLAADRAKAAAQYRQLLWAAYLERTAA